MLSICSEHHQWQTKYLDKAACYSTTTNSKTRINTLSNDFATYTKNKSFTFHIRYERLTSIFIGWYLFLLVSAIRSPPSDLSSLAAQWHWTNRMIQTDLFDYDAFYWLEDQSNNESNIVVKIYSPQTNRAARVRAQRERVALEKLIGTYYKHLFLV